MRAYSSTKALIIGVGQYADPQYDLGYARSDAEAMAELLGSEFGFDQIWTLYDNDATKANITRLFEQDLQRVDEDDGLLIFFAGHGITVTSAIGDDRGFLIPHDGNPKERYTNISLASIRDDYLPNIPAKHVFLIVDACYGGLALRDVAIAERPQTVDEAVLAELTRCDHKVRQVLAAGGKDQRVLDGGLFGHSVFTGRLIEALREANPYITADHVGVHVRERVAWDSADRKHRQTPQFGYLAGGEGSFVLCRYGEQQVQQANSRIRTIAGEGLSHGRADAPYSIPMCCPSCNFEVSRDWKVCPQCGTRLRPHCIACGTQLQTSWRACPACGEAVDKSLLAPTKMSSAETPSASEDSSAGDTQHAPAEAIALPQKQALETPTLRQLIAFASSSEGLDYDKEDSALWAEERLDFFAEHSFALWKKYFGFAYSTDGLDLDEEDSALWADDWIAFFQQHDFALWYQLFRFAYSIDGMDYDEEDSAQWAMDRIELYERHGFRRWNQLFSFACSTDGLDLDEEDSALWADDWVSFFVQHEFDLWKQLFAFAYSNDGMDYDKEDSAQWAFDKTPFFEQQDFSKWRRLFDTAYSSDGLDYDREDSADWADEKIVSNSRRRRTGDP